jgi:integrase
MGRKHICTLEGEYLHDGERRVCKFNITERRIGNYKTLRMDANPKGQKRFSKTRPTLDLLKDEFRKWQEENRPPGDSLERKLTRLSEDQILDAEKAVRHLPKGLSLVEAVELASREHRAKSMSFAGAYKNYIKLKFKDEQNRDGKWKSSKTKAEFETVMRFPLLHLGNRVIKTIEPQELPQYWQKGNRALGAKNRKSKISPISDQSRLNRFKVLQKFFKWCYDREYHYENIMAEKHQTAPSIEKSEKSPPSILSNEKTTEVLEYARNSKRYWEWIPYLAFLHLAGVRPGEAHGGAIDLPKNNRKTTKTLTWDHFQLSPQIEDPFVQLPYSGKMASNRIVKLPQNLVNILKLSKEKGIPFYCPKITSNTMKRFRVKVGLKDSNSARHTAISNWYRHSPITNKPATELELTNQFGNREDTRAEFYINTEKIGVAEARSYWNIGSGWKTICSI